MAVDTGPGPGDFPSFEPSGRTAAPPACADEGASAATPIDGIDMASRRNAAAARVFLKSYPSKKPPCRLYKRLFYLMNSILSMVASVARFRRNRATDP